MATKIAKLYEDPKTGLMGKTAFIKKYNLNQDQVEQYLNSLDAYSLNQPVVQKFSKIKIISIGVYYQFQADLVDMQQFSDENDGYKYLFTCIDVTSRYAWVVPMKNKTAKSTVAAFQTIVDGGNKPYLLQTDDGSEFIAKEFQKYCEKEDIHHFVAPSNSNCAFVERFHRTLKMRMSRYWTLKGNYRYIDVLQDLVDNYNETVHSATKMKPYEVDDHNQGFAINNSNSFHVPNEFEKLKDPKYKIGDLVRISKEKTTFQRETDDKFNQKIFKVDDVIHSNPVTYRLKSSVNDEKYPDRFYEQELIPYTGNLDDKLFQIGKILDVKTQNRKKMILVQWEGYSASEASWEPYNDLKDLEGIADEVKELEKNKRKRK